ncbi:hypothetical protein RND81_07G196700 [Saponaria officinalis]|uniref:Uncharacterized protein n=1 Tax=Saponaria officinalis TaxID=3572 RepID=A0AAW1JTU5_SAPOF
MKVAVKLFIIHPIKLITNKTLIIAQFSSRLNDLMSTVLLLSSTVHCRHHRCPSVVTRVFATLASSLLRSSFSGHTIHHHLLSHHSHLRFLLFTLSVLRRL